MCQGSVWQIVDAFEPAVLKPQQGRKPAPAPIIDPLLGYDDASEAREATAGPGSHRYLLDDSSLRRTTHFQDLRHRNPGINDLAAAAERAVPIRCPAVAEH